MRDAGFSTLAQSQSRFDIIKQEQLIYNLLDGGIFRHLLHGIHNQFAVTHNA